MKKTKRKASQRNFDFVNLGAIFILAVSFIIVLIIIINDINRVRENFTAFSPKTAALRLILPDDQMPKAQVPILMYHHIANNPKPGDALDASLYLPPSMFDQQMKYLANNGYHAIHLQDMYDYLVGYRKSLPSKPIIISVDDGYLDFYLQGFSIIKKYHLTNTFFVIADYPDKNSAYANFKQLKEMADYGIEMGSHTLNHPDLSKLPIDQANQQISQSRQILKSKINQPINFFAYPGGHYSNAVIDLVKKAGYDGAVTVNGGKEHSSPNLFELTRVRVVGDGTLASFIDSLK